MERALRDPFVVLFFLISVLLIAQFISVDPVLLVAFLGALSVGWLCRLMIRHSRPTSSPRRISS